MRESDPKSSRPEITRLLGDALQGNDYAKELLYEAVYRELKKIARRRLREVAPGQTLQTTAVVHEAYLKLTGAAGGKIVDRSHFFAVASRAMRQIVVDHERARSTVKRGGAYFRLSIDPSRLGDPSGEDSRLLALDAALHELERLDDRLGRVVELRFFGGLTVDEVGETLDLSPRTIKRDWRRARAFLQSRLMRQEA